MHQNQQFTDAVEKELNGKRKLQKLLQLNQQFPDAERVLIVVEEYRRRTREDELRRSRELDQREQGEEGETGGEGENMNEGDGALPTSLLNSVTEINHSTSSVVTDSTSNDDTSSLINSPRVCYSPKGSKEYIAGCLHHLKPSLGMIFDSLKDAELFYKVYAAHCSFQVRNGTDKNGKQTVGKEIVEVILLKYFLCTKQGYFQPKPRNQDAECSQTRKRSVTRSGCSACIRLRYSSGGKYVQKQYIFNNAKVNIGPVKSYRMSKEHCGSYNNVRGTKTDFINFYRDLKVYIGDKDAFMFKENFERKVQASNGGFYFDYCVDKHKHLTRAFWADSICRKNYALFGDVVTFDSTYDTNKYCLVFSPFTRVDHYKKCVTFGSALLSKEDTDSFVWLFETFLKCMGNCEPYCLLTDQDPAMSIAIKKVFKTTKRRLCMWHIMRKVPDKVGPVLCKETDFLKKLNAVVWDSDLDPTEFVSGWEAVMKEFSLENHYWLSYMFKIKHK
ncbi:protein FAR1-RELATED SEQUENCE 5-like [Spinacia oleracea]|uniref:Protein FAR1-RELATED SEQUENCE 5-like n=1 Tax=Spinacia oleracea TaxID=3562 RepID=A0ABM3R8H5_SPIOL|nr:protein FAR1-RELATED SEQUENCE 5-like [Spinacia oleracea]